MNLQFTNKGGNFVSEFEVTSDFNLHIEGVRLSDMHIYQKTAGGSYAKVTDFPSERSQDRVADFDFASLVYPKFIKVVCATEPTYAEIATDGEVTEIKSQSKEVEITSNGVTEIAPDAGFGYLSGVKVNVNVPQSGGGESGGGTETGSMEYFLCGKGKIALMESNCQYIKFESPDYGIKMITPYNAAIAEAIAATNAETIAFGINLQDKVIMSQSGTIAEMTVLSYLTMNNITEEEIAAFPHITKEEFYTL